MNRITYNLSEAIYLPTSSRYKDSTRGYQKFIPLNHRDT
ncbi:hypothetical protein KCTC52924_03742 [Arenibacter antarcticus]